MDKSNIFFDSNTVLALNISQKKARIRKILIATFIPFFSILCIFCSFLIPKSTEYKSILTSQQVQAQQIFANKVLIEKKANSIKSSLLLSILPTLTNTLSATNISVPVIKPLILTKPDIKTAVKKTPAPKTTTKTTLKTLTKTATKATKHLGGGDTAPVTMKGKHALDEALPVAKLDPKTASAQYGIPEYWPLPVPVSDPYGYRPWRGRVHSGIDLTADEGTPICAAGAGKIIRAEWYCGYGNCIDVEHASGYVTRYGHLSSYYVKVGQWVDEGEWIGGVGTTGNSSCNHLHFEVFLNGRTINPESLRFINKVTFFGNGLLFASVVCQA